MSNNIFNKRDNHFSSCFPYKIKQFDSKFELLPFDH